MDEMFRMLGREHQADLEREAESRRLAKYSRGDRAHVAPASARPGRSNWLQVLVSRRPRASSSELS
jgi:hypothetical protein